MNCASFDVKGYLLGELPDARRSEVEAHAAGCAACAEELERLRATQAALCALKDEEPPRRIAFVSDKVFEPSWWRRLWNSGPALGLASALLLSAAIVVHALVPGRAAAPVVQAADTAAVEARIRAAVSASLEQAEARQAERLRLALAEAEKRWEFQHKADRLAVVETFEVMQKQMRRMYVASNELGVRR